MTRSRLIGQVGCPCPPLHPAPLIALPAPASVTVAGLFLVGFAAAHADRTIGVQIGAAGLGGALIPAGLGVLIGGTSVAVLGPALTVLAVILLALHLTAARPAA